MDSVSSSDLCQSNFWKMLDRFEAQADSTDAYVTEYMKRLHDTYGSTRTGLDTQNHLFKMLLVMRVF